MSFKNSLLNTLILFLMMSFVTISLQNNAYAVAQWSRKYKTSCTTCHTSFPRLNYYGERFMKNGFQDPDSDEPDGGTLRKIKKPNFDIGQIGDLLGLRINISPFIYKTNGLTVDGKKKDLYSIGKFGWIQFFTAGTITKNISFFDELEFEPTTLKHGWFILGLHNLLNSKLVNFQIGKISPTDWTSFSNRLRIFPEVTALADKVAPSAGATGALDNVAVSSGQFGTNYYGYYGPAVWTLGVGNAKNTDDVNQFKNFWGSLKWEVSKEDSAFAGTSVSFFAYKGTDTKATSTAQIKNTYVRYQPSFNLRWKDWDVITSYHIAREDNYTLAAVTAQPENFQGETIILSKIIRKKYQLGAQYDNITQEFKSAGVKEVEQERLAGHASWLVRDNLNFIASGLFDITDHTKKQHTVQFIVRSMF